MTGLDRAAFEAEMRKQIEHGQEVVAQEAAPKGDPVEQAKHTWHEMAEVAGTHGDGGFDAGTFGVVTRDYGAQYPTEEARDIFQRLLPEWGAHFLAKNAKYAAVDHLGAAGCFPEINRKHAVLWSRIWDGVPYDDTDEDTTRRVILDQIGHLFLMLTLLDEEERDA